MLRLASIEGIELEATLKAIHDLKLVARRRIRERCLQCLDQMQNLTRLTAKVNALTFLTVYIIDNEIPDLLSILEPVHDSSFSNPPEKRTEEPPPSLPQRDPPKDLRYTAYGASPTSSHKRQSSTPIQTKDTEPSAPKFAYNRRSGSASGQDSDLIQLASMHSATKSLTSSPPISPATSPRRQILPTPRSPEPGTPVRGSPATRAIQLQPTPANQDPEISFDISWDRLGAQAGLTSRGWFEGSADRLLGKLKERKGILKVETLSQDGTEMKVKISRGTSTCLMRLRQEEDQSTLWLLRSLDSNLRSSVKTLLLEQ
ncbi:hypothetical protein FRC17_006197 [Serendipita sp. 399]|nr:hypothetical protein FRC17_006197 [Serendipita sp. 399]